MKEAQGRIAESRRNAERFRNRERSSPSDEPVRLRRRRRANETQEISEEELKRREREAENIGINEALRKLQPGEKRLIGHLTKINCRRGKIFFLVRSPNGLVKFTSKDFQSLEITIYETKHSNLEIGCGTVKSDMFSVFSYRPNKNQKSNLLGEIISIDFVPEDFKFVDDQR